jgi:acetylornithine deacetylase/succinyl-diaminopimelate desuccinylase-like protein
MKPMHAVVASPALGALIALVVQGQSPVPVPNWSDVEPETMRHYQAVLRLDTSNPPGNEHLVTDYLKGVFDGEGIPAQVFAKDPNRPNIVARLKGNGSKRPLLVMGHSDVVTVDPAKWEHPPFSATRSDGYVYGRGAVDDKDNLTAGLMTMILLNRLKVPLDRDVIFMSEAGEESGDPVGMEYMVTEHFPDIDAEYCLAEGGGITRVKNEALYAGVETTEKIPRGMELVAHGTSGHGSIPLESNAIVHLAAAVARLGTWRPDIHLNETTRAYFSRLADVSESDVARHYRDVLSSDPQTRRAADDWLYEHEPRHSSMLRTSVSPNIFNGGYRFNVIPSEAKATLDVRALPDEDPQRFLEAVKAVINDPAIDVNFTSQTATPSGVPTALDSDVFKAVTAAASDVYDVPTIPMMSTGATDMAELRAKGVQCVGIGPATDLEDGPKGFGAHSDQERLLETELYRFVRFNWDVVTRLATSAR